MGTLFLVTAILGYWQYRTSKRQTEIADTDLDSKIVAQLDSPAIEVRVAGLVEMKRSIEREPNNSERVLEIVEAFIKRSSAIEARTSSSSTPPAPPLSVRRPDVQNALRVFSDLRQDASWGEVCDHIQREISLHFAPRPTFQLVDLSGADVRHGKFHLCDFQCSDLREANLSQASLLGCRLNGTNFKGSTFTYARLGQAYLLAAILDEAQLFGANFTMAVLAGASMKGADLRDCEFAGAYLEALTLRADWSDPELIHEDPLSLNYARRQVVQTAGALAREGLLFPRILQQGPTYPACDLRGADVRGADFSLAVLSGAVLTGARADQTTRWPQGFDPGSAGVIMT
ncbi:pentapeptide repeat-containing protein [Streptomyces massasporeus]|uniref:pentapeptide repeat-containing protein n=1 Tax=Streptomyces massasporeus TaxID=67324 RepID=UPI0033FB5940